ncbi:FprA family A-type flavoprotein [Peptostreptococcus russellii]|uniref:FprA family A-type flavoprotein n=1 Tax=Peptostreptococcus russellii TaxID=215200 RepID=UPI0016252720|nr:FprA family A-type flavoprotein [Peptostreptococcus russellii]MBC2578038.1 FprA family A-type flavoprotein [Peptostreptococcus russellii]
MNTVSVKILEDLYYMGVNDRETNLFENMWPLPEGVAYNSYLITDEKTALLDTVKIIKVDGFVENLKANLGGRNLDYLVVHHMEPDHSGCMKTIMELYPDVTIVTNKKARAMIDDYLNIEIKNYIEVKNGDTLDLGRRKLNFVTTPMVHWPESMVSYESTDKILFSQDIFGGYGALNGTIFDDEMNFDFFKDETRRYYSNIVGKYSKQAARALEKVKELDIDIICPVHGIVWRSNPELIVDEYIKLANQVNEEGVVIAYGSMYGNTEKMADQLARFIAEEGIKNVKVFDVSKTHVSYILSEIWKYKGVVLGSCTYNNSVYPNMNQLLYTLKMNKLSNHALGIFGSYGWSGGAVKELTEFASEGGNFEVAPTVVETKGTMKEEDIESLRALAKEIAQLVRA